MAVHALTEALEKKRKRSREKQKGLNVLNTEAYSVESEIEAIDSVISKKS